MNKEERERDSIKTFAIFFIEFLWQELFIHMPRQFF